MVWAISANEAFRFILTEGQLKALRLVEFPNRLQVDPRCALT